VIVPVRNDAPRLGVCLEALRASSLADHEVIVVDDASTDLSAGLAEAMGAQVIRQGARSGPAAARNRGAAAARGRTLVFVDADVRIRPDTLARLAEALDAEPALDAVFGSYDAAPAAPGALSRYRNLLHHFVHQTANREAATFWAGCGAIRREVFVSLGGFADTYRRPSVEDIELGARLRRAGGRIALRPEIQVTHLKAWTLVSVLRSDVCDRAIPWTRLALRDGHLPNDLNLRTSQRASAALTYGSLVALVLGARWPSLLGVALASLAAVVVLNRRLYSFFGRQGGARLLAVAVPMHLLYYVYSGIGFAVGATFHLAGRSWSRTKTDEAAAPASPGP
jgi:glycosyltransferase involved in cell wall biosynthesis